MSMNGNRTELSSNDGCLITCAQHEIARLCDLYVTAVAATNCYSANR